MLFDADDFIDTFIIDFNETTGFITTEEECSNIYDVVTQLSQSIAVTSLNPCFFTASNLDEEMISCVVKIKVVGDCLNAFVTYADEDNNRGGEIPYLFIYEI